MGKTGETGLSYLPGASAGLVPVLGFFLSLCPVLEAPSDRTSASFLGKLPNARAGHCSGECLQVSCPAGSSGLAFTLVSGSFKIAKYCLCVLNSCQPVNPVHCGTVWEAGFLDLHFMYMVIKVRDT